MTAPLLSTCLRQRFHAQGKVAIHGSSILTPPMTHCNNISEAHDPITIGEDENALRVFCRICHANLVLRKDPNKGTPENKAYSKVFKRDVLQGNDNLFYKYHPQYLSVV